MINSKDLLEMTPKCQRQSFHGRRQQWKSEPEEVLAYAGHFVIYTIDESRFMILLAYLNQEFGFTGCGPLKVPCEVFVMEYIIFLLNRNPPIEVEKALISVTTCKASIPSLALLQIAPDHSIHPSF
ncbi:hypothetical protein AMTRI_Chr05g63350 [Amborella trichopoda]